MCVQLYLLFASKACGPSTLRIGPQSNILPSSTYKDCVCFRFQSEEYWSGKCRTLTFSVGSGRNDPTSVSSGRLPQVLAYAATEYGITLHGTTKEKVAIVANELGIPTGRVCVACLPCYAPQSTGHNVNHGYTLERLQCQPVTRFRPCIDRSHTIAS